MKPPSKWTEAAVGFLQISWAHASTAEIARALTLMTGDDFTAHNVRDKGRSLRLPKIGKAETERRSRAAIQSDAVVTYQGRDMPLCEAHRLSGSAVRLETVRSRLRADWPLLRALIHDVRQSYDRG